MDKEEDVTAKMIAGVRVRFIPETHYQKDGGGGSGRRAVRGLTDTLIEWEEWKGVEKKPAKPKPKP